jgi:hypothetical protein
MYRLEHMQKNEKDYYSSDSSSISMELDILYTEVRINQEIHDFQTFR